MIRTKKPTFVQTFWNKLNEDSMDEFTGWIGDCHAESKVFFI